MISICKQLICSSKYTANDQNKFDQFLFQFVGPNALRKTHWVYLRLNIYIFMKQMYLCKCKHMSIFLSFIDKFPGKRIWKCKNEIETRPSSTTSWKGILISFDNITSMYLGMVSNCYEVLQTMTILKKRIF